jgi:hypothetical protein
MAEKIPDLRPPKTELSPGYWEVHGAAVAWVLGLVLVLLAWLTWRLTRRKPVPAPAPSEALRRQLTSWKSRPEDGALLSETSRLLTHYALIAGGQPPAELTREELAAVLAARAGFPAECRAAVEGFLAECEARKFSPAPAAAPGGVVERALSLLDRLDAAQPARQEAAAGEGKGRPS